MATPTSDLVTQCERVTSNPNPRYWRSRLTHYIVNFEKVACIFRAVVSTTGEPGVMHDANMLPLPSVVQVCVALDTADKAFLFHLPRAEFEELLAAYESWLTER